MQALVGRIFRIQRFSIHDGPGIRTTVFLKGCPIRCIWCHNPESQSFEREIGYRKEKCIKCFECCEVCGKKVIHLGEDISLMREKCDGCGDCVYACPSGALEIYGMDVTVSNVMELIERDRVFYKNSGGGVTFSGGEPYFQPDFLLSLLEECKERGFSTAVDTSGFAEWRVIEASIDYVDLYLYDLKDYRSDRHRKFCGVGNELILDNLRNLVDAGKELVVRIPVIPGYNFSEGDFYGYIDVLAKLDCSRVDLLPFHSLAKDKYRWLGREWSMPEIGDRARKMASAFSEVLKAEGFLVTIGGYF